MNEDLEVIEHQESLNDLIQMGDSFNQDLREAIDIRINEILEENNIDPDDVDKIYSGVTVSITINYKQRKEEDNE